MASSTQKPIPIYSTAGDWAALMIFPYIYNTVGEWIGWVTPQRDVFNIQGVYVGWLTKDPRILRKRITEGTRERRISPPPPRRIRPPATVPLPPMMSELPFEIMDVFDEEFPLLTTADFGEFREDMD